MRQIVIAGRPVTPKHIVLDGTAHTEINDRGLRLTKSQEQSGVIATICFVCFIVGLLVIGVGRALGAL